MEAQLDNHLKKVVKLIDDAVVSLGRIRSHSEWHHTLRESQWPEYLISVLTPVSAMESECRTAAGPRASHQVAASLASASAAAATITCVQGVRNTLKHASVPNFLRERLGDDPALWATNSVAILCAFDNEGYWWMQDYELRYRRDSDTPSTPEEDPYWVAGDAIISDATVVPPVTYELDSIVGDDRATGRTRIAGAVRNLVTLLSQSALADNLKHIRAIAVASDLAAPAAGGGGAGDARVQAGAGAAMLLPASAPQALPSHRSRTMLAFLVWNPDGPLPWLEDELVFLEKFSTLPPATYPYASRLAIEIVRGHNANMTALGGLIAQHKPDILYFAGHTVNGMLEMPENDRFGAAMRPLNDAFLINTLNSLAAPKAPDVVVFNACSTQPLVDSVVLSTKVGIAIGTTKSLPDSAAYVFMQNFLLCLGSGLSVLAAVNNAKTPMDASGLHALPENGDLFVEKLSDDVDIRSRLGRSNYLSGTQ